MATVVITAGHSDSDPGAVNRATGITEANIVKDARFMVKYYLEQKGHTVITDGERNENQPLSQAVKLIPKGKLAIELHCNASANPKSTGVEMLCHIRHREIAQKVCTAIHNAMGIPLRGDRGWKAENSGQHSRLAYVSNGGMILELFFISNPEELATWEDKKWVICKAIAGAIDECL